MGGKVEVITGKNNINVYRMLTLLQALKLECKGMKRRGCSVLSIVKREFHLTGRKEKVYKDFCVLVDEAKKDQTITLAKRE